MEEADLQQVITAIKSTIDEHVNGKIDGLREDVSNLRKDFSDHEEKMDPIAKGWETVQQGRSFLIWIGAPLAIIGGIVAFFK